MLLTMSLILAICSTLLEIKLVSAFKFIDRAYTNGALGLPGEFWNFAGSMGLAALMGAIFGAQGVAIMLGGVMGSALSTGYFWAKRILNANNWDWKRFKTQFESTSADIVRYTQLLGRALVFCIKAITAPFRAADWVRLQTKAAKVKIEEIKVKSAA